MYILKCHVYRNDYSPEGNIRECPVKILKCWFKWTFAIKLIYARLFYDSVEIEEI